jgi:hypothetical protein
MENKKQYIPCGGCGAQTPLERCIGCRHPFTKEEQEIINNQLKQSEENIEWDSERIIGRVKERFKELEEKKWDWRSFYNGWLEGRADMLMQIKKIGWYKPENNETA